MSQCRDLWQLIGQLERRTPFESLRHSLAVQFPYHRLSALLWLRFLGQLIPTFLRKKYFSSGLLDWGPGTKTIHTKKTLGRSKCWSGEGLDGFETNSTFRKVSAGFSEEVESGINKQSRVRGSLSSSACSARWSITKVYNQVGDEEGTSLITLQSCLFESLYSEAAGVISQEERRNRLSWVVERWVRPFNEAVWAWSS